MSVLVDSPPAAGPEPLAARRFGPDARLGAVHWPIPDTAAARRRSLLMALVCIPLAVWYLAWLLHGNRVGNPILFGLLIAAEAFNLVQGLGFWWTCARQRTREGRPPTAVDVRVDILIPVYGEPLSVVEPTVAAACALTGAEATVWLLDDGRRGEMAQLAGRYGASYLRRRVRSGWRRPHPALAAISVDEVLNTVAELGRTAGAAAA